MFSAKSTVSSVETLQMLRSIEFPLQFIPRAGPHSQILMERGGGGEVVRQRFIFYTQKDHNFRICLPKKITTFFRIPQNTLSPFFATQKNPSVFFSDPPKIPASFTDPKNHFWPKFQTPKNHSDPPSLKYVSGAP